MGMENGTARRYKIDTGTGIRAIDKIRTARAAKADQKAETESETESKAEIKTEIKTETETGTKPNDKKVQEKKRNGTK